jgi:hypothetical protein
VIASLGVNFAEKMVLNALRHGARSWPHGPAGSALRMHNGPAVAAEPGRDKPPTEARAAASAYTCSDGCYLVLSTV